MRRGSNIVTRPLYFFQAGKTIELNANLRIRPITKIEKYPVVQDATGRSVLGQGWGWPQGFNHTSFVVECLGDTGSKASEEVNRLATCLLLFKRETNLQNSLSWFGLGGGGNQSTTSEQLPTIDPNAMDLTTVAETGYHLGSSEIDRFKSFWSELSKEKWHSSLVASARRLVLAQSRAEGLTFEDRLVDIIIAFESLVLMKCEQHKGKKLPYRGGKLQQLTGDLEKRAIEELSLAYTLRNDIVHDGLLDPEHMKKIWGPSSEENWIFFRDFLNSVETYLRVGMLNYIGMMKRYPSKEEIVKELGDPPDLTRKSNRSKSCSNN